MQAGADNSDATVAGVAGDDAAGAPILGLRARLSLACGLLAMGLLLALHWHQQRSAVCGDQFEPGPATLSPDWWSCPIEVNRHRRVVGQIGRVRLNGVHVNADLRRGWAVGDDGTIVATLDGGATWARQASPTRANLMAVSFSSDGQRGWAVGGGGTILATRDGGVSWQLQTSGTDTFLRAITLSSDGRLAWVVGGLPQSGIVVSTRDGGATWAQQAVESRGRLRSVSFLSDGQRGWAVSELGTILSTTNGGASWDVQRSGGNWLNAITFRSDGLHGWAVGGDSSGVGSIVATRDGGKTWAKQNIDTPGWLVDVHFDTNGLNGQAISTNGRMLTTPDGGATWVSAAGDGRTKISGAAIRGNGGHAWMVGFEGSILATSDRGGSWQMQAGQQRAELSAVAFDAEGRRGWAVGESGAILASGDGGASWAPQRSASRANLRAVAVSADGRTGWAVGSSFFGRGTILATRDSGNLWLTRTTNVDGDLSGTSISADGQRGWAVGGMLGEKGTIVATRDAGMSWATQGDVVPFPLSAVTFIGDGQRGWAVGVSGAMLATRNGGEAWRPQFSNSRAWLDAVSFHSGGQRGWAVGRGLLGSASPMLATRDGGATWEARDTGTQLYLQAIGFSSDGQRGWTLGTDRNDASVILATRDGGAAWAPQAIPAQARLRGLSVHGDGQRAWAVGEAGTIVATRDGGDTWLAVPQPYARWPSPLHLLGAALLLVASAGVPALGWLRPIVRRLSDRILGRAVADAPVTRPDEDRLNFWPVVQALALFLGHAATVPPVTLAITAPWGKGKSSMMRMLQGILARRGLNTVWFNAWHHQKEPVLMAALLNAVIAQGTPPWWSLAGLRFRTRLLLRRVGHRPLLGAVPLLLWLVLVVALPASVLLAGVLSALTPDGGGTHPLFAWWADGLHAAAGRVAGNAATEALLAGEWARFSRETLGAVGRDPAKVLPLLATLWLGLSVFLLFTHFARPFPARPGALLASVGNKFSLAQAEEQTGFRQRFREHFADVAQALRPHTLTVFIDDLDRCEPKIAAEVLEAVNYLTDAGPCFVVLGIARELVEAQLGQAHAELASRSAQFDTARRADAAPAAGTAPPANSQPVGPAAPGSIELAFARRYLAKLIQIDVPVPALDGDGLRQLLSDGSDAGVDPGQDAARQAAADLRDALRRDQAWARLARGLGWLARVGVLVLLLATVAWQGMAWLDDHAKLQAQRQTGQWDRVRADELQILEVARPYVAWLRTQTAATVAATAASATGAGSSARAASAAAAASATAPTPVDTHGAAGRKAWLEQCEQWLALAVEQARLQRELLRDNKLQQLDDSRLMVAKLLAPLVEATRTTAGYSQPQVVPRPVAAQASGPVVPPDPLRRDQRLQETRPAGTGDIGPDDVHDTTQWTLTLPLLLLAALAVAGVLASRERQVIVESNSYRAALQACQPLLATLPAMQAPREAKRFLNLSRYLTVRLLGQRYSQPGPLQRWWLDRSGRQALLAGTDLPLTEQQVVVLTALHLVRTQLAPQQPTHAWLQQLLAGQHDATDLGSTTALRQALAGMAGAPAPGDDALRQVARALDELRFDPPAAR